MRCNMNASIISAMVLWYVPPIAYNIVTDDALVLFGFNPSAVTSDTSNIVMKIQDVDLDIAWLVLEIGEDLLNLVELYGYYHLIYKML